MIQTPLEERLCVWTPDGYVPSAHLTPALQHYRTEGKRIITTNGCFDILHGGHIQFLDAARQLGDVLIVGLNSDSSVEKIKGIGRPFLPQSDRAAILAALGSVDHVLIFTDMLPIEFLEFVRPDIHCKAGDYSADQIPEAEIVEHNGGVVRILPTLPGYSTSQLVHRILKMTKANTVPSSKDKSSHDPSLVILDQLLTGSNLLRQTAYRLAPQIEEAADKIIIALKNGGKILACGNGGSAADAQHFVAELIGRFRRERGPLPAIALTVDTSVLTSLSNDYGYDHVFTRQVLALGQSGDILIAISTGGTSSNVLRASEVAKERGLTVIALTGIEPSPLDELADISLSVPSQHTALIQQAHIAILHVFSEMVERELANTEIL